MLVDLHTHSTYSDGRYTPAELVQTAVSKNIRVLVLTDHDSWNGYAAAAMEAERLNNRYLELLATGLQPQAAFAGLQAELASLVAVAESKSTQGNIPAVLPIQDPVLPCGEEPLLKVFCGLELSTMYKNKSVHVLGYHVSRSCAALQAKMEEMRGKRQWRLNAILAKVRALGMDVQISPCDSSLRSVGRPHVAKAMVAKGYVGSVQEAFDKYLRRGGPCYVEQPKLTPAEAVELIHLAGGLAVLAHPSEIKQTDIVEELLQTIPFDGLEVWHPSALESNEVDKWLSMAAQHQLLTSGGSDFHGIPDRYPDRLGIWQVAYSKTQAVIEYTNKLSE